MSRLLAFGCSFTYGHGLEDCHIPPNLPGRQPSKSAWPEILASRMGRMCVNLSYPGASNKQIWHTLMKTTVGPGDLVIIGWTLIDRWCVLGKYADEHGSIPEYTIGTWAKHKMAKAYYSKLYNQEDANIDANLRMHHAGLYLNSLGVENYHTIFQFKNLEKLPWNSTPSLQADFGRIESTHKKALDGRHPGQGAHREYALKLYEEIKENR